MLFFFFFFFQAEDGIRDVAVTGVQTCALPIYSVTVFRIVSGIGKGSSFVIVAGVEVGAVSSLGFFLPNRISCMRSWNGAPEPFPRNRSMPLVITRERRGAGLL